MIHRASILVTKYFKISNKLVTHYLLISFCFCREAVTDRKYLALSCWGEKAGHIYSMFIKAPK